MNRGRSTAISLLVVLAVFAGLPTGSGDAVAAPAAVDVAARPPPAAPLPPPLPPATDVKLAPSSRGVIGAWLVAGPFRAGRPGLDAAPAGVDEQRLDPSLGAVVGGERDLGNLGTKRRPPARWTMVPSTGGDPGLESSRTIDLKASLEDGAGSDLVAYAGGRLHVDRAGRYLLLLGVDDGVRVTVDRKVVLTRDGGRPLRDDDDIVPLDLAAGDHEVLLKLHQKDGAWAFRAKIVEPSLSPPPGAYLELPGTTAADAGALAARMSWLVVDRTFDPKATPPVYRPVVTVRYPEGVPRGVPIAVKARYQDLEIDAGGVAVTESGASDLVVALPPVPPTASASAAFDFDVAGREVKAALPSRPATEQALVRAEHALAAVTGDEPWLLPGSLDSIRFLNRRLARLLARADGDAEAQLDEAHELDRLAGNLEAGRERRADPYDGQRGMMRRALVTPFDGGPTEYGLYIPPSYKGPTDPRRYPLVIGLHGLNSYPISLMRALFGLDDEKKESIWKDRHSGQLVLPPVDAFVLTPYAHGNSFYRELGEDDVLYLMHWAMKTFPIDETRVTVTGPSMGGIGAASLPFHFPNLFAASEPLCGYHSYLIRSDIMSRPIRPWEHALLEERSNVLWAENGEHLPLWIVHGTRDLPEANSGVLIERYEALKYSVKHDHPDAGHNVWGPTWADLKGMKWLLGQRLDPHPSHVRFRTMRARYGTSAWLTVDELANESSWGDVDARVKSKTAIVGTASGIAQLTFARDDKVLDPRAKITVTMDGTALAFDEGEPLVLHKTAGASWAKGSLPPATPTPRKRGHVTGPLRDVLHEPVLFVYAADDEARINERVAKSFADRPGVPASYPIISDAQFLERGEPLANDRALFLVGRTNKVLALLEAQAPADALPIHIGTGSVTVGKTQLVGSELGAAFIHPNPLRPDRYVVVVAGADAVGMLRAVALPELLPDFMVWDETLAPARNQLVLGAGAFRAAGMFKNDWSLPASIVDPLARARRAAAPTDPEVSADAP